MCCACRRVGVILHHRVGEDKAKVIIMEDGRLSIVELEGHNYFVVDQDLSKGDFFHVIYVIKKKFNTYFCMVFRFKKSNK